MSDVETPDIKLPKKRRGVPKPPVAVKRFRLKRLQDVSGVSGTGYVAEGVEFVNGMVALSWSSPHACVNVYHSIRTVEELHGHENRTLIEWID